MLDITDMALKKYFINQIVKWGRNNYVPFPWRSSKNRWHSLVVEIMLQRTKAEQVLPVYNSFCMKYPKPEHYYKDNNAKVFKSLGLVWREKELKKLAMYLTSHAIPDDKQLLLSLPGVGEYVASAYRSLHINQRDTIIDSNIVRLYGRYFGFQTNPETRRKKWFIQLAQSLTPLRIFRDYNYGLLDFTRAVCKPKPNCNLCPLNKRCEYFRNCNLSAKL